ncbi:hypothetical protein [Sphingobacterium lactis]|uniref:hypothetical protein n=1 Tax=Sphingobacterium lactis TaxID=797291 RepID=UPI003DA459DF
MLKIAVLGLALLVLGCQQREKVQERLPVPVKDSVATGFDSLVFENDTMKIFKIDSPQYLLRANLIKAKDDTLRYISDFQTVKKLLRERVTFGTYDYDADSMIFDEKGEQIALVRFNAGDTMSYHRQPAFTEIGFISYYPTEEVLVMEGGHTSDYTINLKTGTVGPELAGNPLYIVRSPKGTFQLTGWFPGQECSSYLLQKNNGDSYVFYSTFPDSVTDYGFDFCHMIGVYWVSEHEFYFRNTFFSATPDNRLGYFKVLIK